MGSHSHTSEEEGKGWSDIRSESIGYDGGNIIETKSRVLWLKEGDKKVFPSDG